MKITINFSVEQDLANKFLYVIKQKNIDKNRYMERTMDAFIEKHKEYDIVKCEDCGAEYSSKYPRCPNCETKELKETRQIRLDEKRKAEETKIKREQQDKLFREQAEAIDYIRSAEATIQRLEKEGKPDQVKKVSIEVDKKRARLEAISKELKG